MFPVSIAFPGVKGRENLCNELKWVSRMLMKWHFFGTSGKGLKRRTEKDAEDYNRCPQEANKLLKNGVTMDSRFRGNDETSKFPRKSSFPRKRESITSSQERVLQQAAKFRGKDPPR